MGTADAWLIVLLPWLCLVAGVAVVAHRQRVVVRGLADELAAALPTDCPADNERSALRRLADLVAAACDVLAELKHRVPGRNPVTGLRTRETLMAITATAGRGVLGVVELGDFDALSARDIERADAVLKSFADRAVRMIGHDRAIAQIDRARFAIWVETPDPHEGRAELDAFAYALRDRIEVDGTVLLPKVLVGAAVRTSADEPGLALLARAIGNLGDRITSSDAADTPAATAETRRRVELEHDLRHAVARQQFELHYQPFVDAELGVVSGAEALLRWRHPEHGNVSPAVFVPLVEATGLAEEVGLWVLDTAIAQAARWRKASACRLKVAANLSAKQLFRPQLELVVERMLTKHELPADLLELELTETAAALDTDGAARLFDKLRARGVAISIDDFGAGYSSLSYLRRLTFDKLKIDREFVTFVDTDRQNQAICQSILALGRGLGISVLAEGVERAEEYRWLRHQGCRHFQGYYFARPLTAAAFFAFAQDRQTVAALLDRESAISHIPIGALAA